MRDNNYIFHKGDKVKIINKSLQVGTTPMTYDPYSDIMTGTIESIIGNIYYVKAVGHTYAIPYTKDALAPCNEDDTKLKSEPKFKIGEFVILKPEMLEELSVKNTLAKLIAKRYKNESVCSLDNFLKKMIKMFPIRIVDCIYDGNRVAYGLDGFGTLYFYEDEIEQTHNDKLKTYLGALETMLVTAQKISK